VPIRLRLALLFAAGTAVVLVAGSLVFVHFLDAGLRDSVDSGLQLRAATLAQAVAKAGPDPVVLPDQPNGMAQLFDASGRLIASAGAGNTPLLSATARSQARHGAVHANQMVKDQSDPVQAADPTRLLGIPIPHREGAWVVVVGAPLEGVDNAVARVRHAALVGGPFAVLLAGLGAWALATAALRPVERMRHQVAETSTQDPQPALSVPKTRDEVAALASTMNDLLGRLQNAMNRERAFVADAGHELRTPLAILRAELELASRPGRSRAELVEAVHAAAEESDRLARLAEGLLFLAGGDGGAGALRLYRTEIEPLLVAAAEQAQRGDGHPISIEVDATPGLVADVDAVRVRQAVDNLIDNALRHAPPGTTVTVTGRREADALVVEVADEGSGFSANFLPHAFERFRRADSARARNDGGAGLGLAIVRSVANAHHGTATASNRPDQGAVVQIRLPLSASTPTRE
jgi:signal transduction histidine kinase